MSATGFVRGDRVEGTPGPGTVVEPQNKAGNVGVYWDSKRLSVVEWPQACLLRAAVEADPLCSNCIVLDGELRASELTETALQNQLDRTSSRSRHTAMFFHDSSSERVRLLVVSVYPTNERTER